MRRPPTVMQGENADFSKLVEAMLKEFNVPGIAIAIMDGDDIHLKNYGNAQIDGAPITAETLFDCASTSKSFTAASVALLVEDDEYPDVTWTTPVSKILGGDFVMVDPMYTANVTIEDILSHRSGIAPHDDSYLGTNSKQPDTAKSVTRNLRNLALLRPLRTEHLYCNLMFTVATHIVETVTGIPYGEFVKTRLWDPLGMTNTFHDVPKVEAAGAMGRLATGYRWNYELGLPEGVAAYAQPEAQGAGLVYSSPSDWIKWVRAMTRRCGPLSEASHRELTKPRINVIEEDEYKVPLGGHLSYGLGLSVESYRGHELFGHDGGFTGFSSMMRFIPDKDWGIMMIGNTEDAYYINLIMLHALMDDKLGVPLDERVDWYMRWKSRYEQDVAQNKEKIESFKQMPTGGGSIPPEDLVGVYHNTGYHSLSLKLVDGKVVADCSDRCMPFTLTFYPAEGHSFVVKMQYTIDGALMKKTAKASVNEQGYVTALGIAFEIDEDDFVTWFDRVALH